MCFQWHFKLGEVVWSGSQGSMPCKARVKSEEI